MIAGIDPIVNPGNHQMMAILISSIKQLPDYPITSITLNDSIEGIILFECKFKGK